MPKLTIPTSTLDWFRNAIAGNITRDVAETLGNIIADYDRRIDELQLFQHDGNACPRCHADSDSVKWLNRSFEACEFFEDCVCLNCGYKWTDVYTYQESFDSKSYPEET